MDVTDIVVDVMVMIDIDTLVSTWMIVEMRLDMKIHVVMIHVWVWWLWTWIVWVS